MRLLQLAGSGLIGLAFLAIVIAATPHHTVGSTVLQLGPGAPRQDAPNPLVTQANFNPDLVQISTPSPFRGTGAPGINLRVQGAGSIVGWTVEAWANSTTPPAYRFCHRDDIHFAPPDWLFENDYTGNGTGIWQARPTTDPDRVGPDGDQCLPRFGETGTWQITVRIEGKPGGPLGLYYDKDGFLREDKWDYSKTLDIQVHA